MLDTSYIIIGSSEAMRAIIGFRIHETLLGVYLKKKREKKNVAYLIRRRLIILIIIIMN